MFVPETIEFTIGFPGHSESVQFHIGSKAVELTFSAGKFGYWMCSAIAEHVASARKSYPDHRFIFQGARSGRTNLTSLALIAEAAGPCREEFSIAQETWLS